MTSEKSSLIWLSLPPSSHPGPGHSYLLPWLLQCPSYGPSFQRSEKIAHGPWSDWPKNACITLLLIDWQWLPVANWIRCRSLILALRVTSGHAPLYLVWVSAAPSGTCSVDAPTVWWSLTEAQLICCCFCIILNKESGIVISHQRESE